MWKAPLIALLAELCLFGLGLLTVPIWINENVVIWLPAAFFLFLAMICWENWPRWIQATQGFRWVNLETGGRYYRDLITELDMNHQVKMFDSMSSPLPRHPTQYPVASAFRWIVQEAINEGKMEVWGVPENGSRPEKLVNVDDDATAYRQFREGDPLFLMMGGVYYRDLRIKRSTIKSYVEHTWRNEAELEDRKKN